MRCSVIESATVSSTAPKPARRASEIHAAVSRSAAAKEGLETHIQQLYIWVMLYLRTYLAFVKTPLLFLLSALCLSGPAATAQERQLYRYTNSDGNKVVAFQVPPEYVAQGYEILNAQGALVAVVPRQLDESERENMDAQARLERDALEEQERLRQWDETLLLRYSTIEDIEAARERALRELRIRVSILTGELSSLKQQVENYQALAADQERNGQEVNPGYVSGVTELQTQIASTERALDDRRAEISEVDASFDRDIERFETLLDIVELRRQRSVGGA